MTESVKERTQRMNQSAKKNDVPQFRSSVAPKVEEKRVVVDAEVVVDSQFQSVKDRKAQYEKKAEDPVPFKPRMM